MEKKDLRVRCPGCGMELVVDVRTGAILRQQAPRHDGQDLMAETMERLRQKQQRDLFGEAVEKAGAPRDVDEAFRQARRRAREKEGGETAGP